MWADNVPTMLFGRLTCFTSTADIPVLEFRLRMRPVPPETEVGLGKSRKYLENFAP
jgi:hypothetical protein